MNPDMLESADQREKIRRLIFEPLEGRGEPPRGWTTEQLLADYVLALARYPETVQRPRPPRCVQRGPGPPGRWLATTRRPATN